MSSQTSVSARRESCLSYADVVHLYEVLLHRTPSPDEVEGQLAATTEWQVLLSAIAGSAEFAGHVRLAASAAPPIVNTWHSDLANYTHKAGSLSDDASTLVGLDGWLFLIQGSNSVLDQYQSTFDPGANWANEWTEVIDHRRNEAARLGVEIGLLIVPDKLSAMHEFLPQPYSLDRPPPATIDRKSVV